MSWLPLAAERIRSQHRGVEVADEAGVAFAETSFTVHHEQQRWEMDLRQPGRDRVRERMSASAGTCPAGSGDTLR